MAKFMVTIVYRKGVFGCNQYSNHINSEKFMVAIAYGNGVIGCPSIQITSTAKRGETLTLYQWLELSLDSMKIKFGENAEIDW